MQGQQYHHQYGPRQPAQRSGHAPNQRRGGIGPMIASGPHHAVAMTPAQIAQQQQAQAHATEMAKRRSRKPTDKTMPDGIEDTVIDPDTVKLYNNLRAYERRLDATLARKRLDMADNYSRYPKHPRTMRIWISNTAEDQAWQEGSGQNSDGFEFGGGAEASYRVKIEGRLLDDDQEPSDEADAATKAAGQDADKMDADEPHVAAQNTAGAGPKHGPFRFSHFFKSITVDLPSSKTDQSVEWRKPDRTQPSASLPAAADFDEFTFKRAGDENMNITINLHRHEDPERFQLSPELAAVVDMKEATRQEVLMGIWEYVKAFGLQEDEEKRNFRCDELLKKVLPGRELGYLPMVWDGIGQHLRPLPPISLQYTVRVDAEFHQNPEPTIYDVQVTVENPLRTMMLSFLSDPGYVGMLREVSGLDDQLAKLVQAISMSKAKHSFFNSLGQDPVNFFNHWLSSQQRDLEVINGEAPRGGGERADSGEWRKSGRDGVWGTLNARQSVNLLLSRPRQPPMAARQG